MSDLRDTIYDLLAQYAIRMESPVVASTSTVHFADAILDAVAEALTSDAAVDAMLECSYGWVDYEAGTTYKDLPESEKADIRPEGRHELTAALRAAGIMKGEGNAR